VIAAGVDNYTRGLASLELWSEGSARLAKVEQKLVRVQQWLKFVTGKDFLSLLAPLASLVVTIEEASSPVINFPATMRALRFEDTSFGAKVVVL
jgi:hypothetical protein